MMVQSLWEQQSVSRLQWNVGLALGLHSVLLGLLGLSWPAAQPLLPQVDIVLVQQQVNGIDNPEQTQDATELSAPPEALETLSDTSLEKSALSFPDKNALTSVAQQDMRLANLQANLEALQIQQANQPRVKRVTTASALQDEDLRYLEVWRKTIEAWGNQHYPAQAIAQDIYGSLRLMVSVLPDGSVYQIEILKSSGFALLDQAAINIVEMAAPFEPFSKEMRQSFDRLDIIRTWQFEKQVDLY